MKIISLRAVKVLGISITKDSRDSILKYLQKYLDLGDKKQPETLQIVTPNTEQLVAAQHHPWFAKLLNQADVALPDSIGIVWGSRIMGVKSLSGRIPGITFFEDLVALAAKQHVKTAFIGGRGGVAVEAFECLRRKYPGLEGWGEEAPELEVESANLLINQSANTKEYFEVLAKKIIETRTQIIFVALGPPKQELFMEKLKQALIDNSPHPSLTKRGSIPPLRKGGSGGVTPVILMAVGGSFDEISGRIPRSPKWISKIGLKWLWRLILEPWRIKRQLALVEFIWLVLKEKMTKN